MALRPRLIATAEQVAAELTDELAATRRDLEDMLRTATATLSRVRAGTWVALVMNNDPSTSFVVTGDDRNPKLAAYIDGYMASLVRPRTVPTTGVSQAVIESGEPLLVPMVPFQRLFEMTTPAAGNWFAEHSMPIEPRNVAMIVVAMRAHGQVVGTLQFIDWSPRAALDETDVSWIQVIADRLGLLVDHVLCRDAAITRLDRLTAIRNVNRAIASSQDLGLTLGVILEQLTGKLQVDAADVLLVDQAAGDMFVAASVGFHSGTVQDLRLPTPEDLTEAGPNGRRFDSSAEPSWQSHIRRRSLFAREGFVTYRALPLTARGRLVGVLEAFHRTEVDVDQEWLGFLEALSTTAAIAVERAGLQHQVDRGGGTRRSAVQRPELSRVEWRIMAFVVEGSTNREIAGQVHLSENTIKFHIRRLLDRVGAVNRTDLARKATQNNWL